MILLRHGQSYFNLLFTQTKRDPGIIDPELTELGVAQAEAAALRLEGLGIKRIIVSPYKRALQTVEPIRRRLGCAPVVVMHEVRERAAFACDIGSHPVELAARFPFCEFNHLPPVWWHEGVEPEVEVVARAASFRKFMAAQEDAAATLLVSHWAFILALTGVSAANGEVMAYDPRTTPTGELVWRP